MAVLPDFPTPEAIARGWPQTLIDWFSRLSRLIFAVSKGDIVYEIGNRAMETQSDGQLVESDITSTELGYLDGVISNIQPQLDSKTPKGYGGLSVNGNATNLALAAQDTWYQYTYFDTNDPSLGMTPDHTNDHITIGTTGVYLVVGSASFSGSATTTFEGQIFINNGATGFPNAHFERKLGAGGDIGATALDGILNLTAGDTVEFWVQRTDGAAVTKNFVGKDITISLVRLA
jgi:hypothetical protein